MLLIVKHHSYLPKEVGNTQSEIPIHVNGNFPNVLRGISYLSLCKIAEANATRAGEISAVQDQLFRTDSEILSTQ